MFNLISRWVPTPMSSSLSSEHRNAQELVYWVSPCHLYEASINGISGAKSLIIKTTIVLVKDKHGIQKFNDHMN